MNVCLQGRHIGLLHGGWLAVIDNMMRKTFGYSSKLCLCCDPLLLRIRYFKPPTMTEQKTETNGCRQKVLFST